MSPNKSIVEDTALEWFGDLDGCLGHGPQLAPGEQAGGALTPAISHGEREKDEAIRRLNPATAEEAVATHKEFLSVPSHIEKRLKP